LWVVFGHNGFMPLVDGVDLTHLAGRVSRAVYNNLTPGPAAVIVFFVISGFCIHYPFRRASSVPALLPFYARRYLRILIPIAAAITISRPLGIQLDMLGPSILWSLLCEEIYYALYPWLLRLRNRYGWRRLIAASYVVSLALAVTNLKSGEYPAFGIQGNWLLGLPCWLLGCDLAESYAELAALPRPRLWIGWWRLGAVGLSMIASVRRKARPSVGPSAPVSSATPFTSLTPPLTRSGSGWRCHPWAQACRGSWPPLSSWPSPTASISSSNGPRTSSPGTRTGGCRSVAPPPS
jgi:peptidoglycan/LPS O-acetylase OafA/YrhL